jgi:predicted nucleic acid-binding protein
MKYILDASVALRWVLPGPLYGKAVVFRDEYQNNIHEFLAPDIFPGEAASALTKAERQKIIPIGDAAILYAKIATAFPVLHSYFPLIARAIEISSASRCAFYDCLYVAHAEREDCELVTADDKLIKNLQKDFPFIRALSSIA